MAHDASTRREALFAYIRAIPDLALALDASIQRMAIRACARGERLGTPEIFEEERPDGRAAFGLLARQVEEQPATVILATLSVLGDSAVERARRILLLEANGARIVCADGIRPERALRDDWEARPDTERRRERAREAMRREALRGVVLGRPPFGYAVRDRTLVPDPVESKVVRRLFKAYLDEGEGLRRLAGALNRDGIRTRLGREWTPGSVRAVLRNPVYTGLYRRLGVAVPRAHEALVDRATFQAVQQRMSAKRTSRLKQERHEYLFGGLLRCGRCGSPVIGDRRPVEGGIAVVYRCEAATSQGRCRARAIREEAIEAAVLEELARPAARHPIAARGAAGPDHLARQRRLERTLVGLLERWIAGEWRYPELVQRAANTVRRLQENEVPELDALPDAEAARSAILAEWDSRSAADRRLLLRAAIGEITVQANDVRIARRR